MLNQFLSNEKIIQNEHNEYFNISPKQKMFFSLKQTEDNIIKEASKNIKNSLLKIKK
ncbi:hypothetical protein [Peribacillus asahii]|uniref:hypothetical protein n=1 Tax=Peribacillus asahii TaxID=228899 RepID=UPI0020792FD5|nr:hypothetical protein [Peribacillus asahii]USK61360.1 hypothetical protein LIT37_08595 [Peribacillus asahii]